MAKIYHVIQLKLNQFKKISIWSLAGQQNVFNCYHTDKYFSFFIYEMAAKTTGIDMEQNCVTDTLRIVTDLKATTFFSSATDAVVINIDPIVAEWLACWTQAQYGKVLGKLYTPIVPLFTKQRNW